MAKTIIYMDRDGDTLSVRSRPEAHSGNDSWDPILTVTHGNISQSVVFVEDDIPGIVRNIVSALNLTPEQIRKTVIELGTLMIQNEFGDVEVLYE